MPRSRMPRSRMPRSRMPRGRMPRGRMPCSRVPASAAEARTEDVREGPQRGRYLPVRAVMRDDGERELIDDSLERTRLHDGAFHALAGAWHRADRYDRVVAYPVEGLCHAIAARHDLHEVHVERRDQHGYAQISTANTDERAGNLPGSGPRLVRAERGLDALAAFAVDFYR